MSITPKAIQVLLDELEASKQSRLRVWNALRRIRALLSDILAKQRFRQPARKTFDAEGEILEHALTKLAQDRMLSWAPGRLSLN
jgi:hypothetical protein